MRVITMKYARIVSVTVFLTVAFVGVCFLIGAYQSLSVTGGCDQRASPYLKKYYDDQRIITYCKSGDADIDKITTSFFVVSNYISFVYSGYPEQDDIEIYLRDISGYRFAVDLSNAGESWRLVNIAVPQELKGKKIQLVAEDLSADLRGWIGIGNIVSGNIPCFNFIKVLAILFTLHLVLIVWLSLLQRYSTSEIAPLLLMLLFGLAGYVAFWAYYSNDLLGRLLSWSLLLATVVIGMYQCWRYGVRSYQAANGVLLPVVFYVLLILIIGSYPFLDVSGSEAMRRWFDLPIDNLIPKIFADQILEGNVKSPMLGDWLSSDRPPLQAGIYLMFPVRGELMYQVMSSMMQGLVLVPFLTLIRTLGEERLSPYATIAFGLTSMAAFHTFYVWPKLLSAVYLIIFYLVTTTTLGDRMSKREWWFVAGGSAALALLSHGGAFFSLLVLSIFYLLRYRVVALSLGLPAVFVSLLIYVPWVFYQGVIDPPGNRLIKWHLAGMIEPNDMSTFQALHYAYSNIHLYEWIDARYNNLLIVFKGSFGFFKDFFYFSSDFDDWHYSMLSNSYYETFYSFWWFSPLLALTVWFSALIWKRQYLSKDVILLATTSLVTLIVWCLLMFLPGLTVLEQGALTYISGSTVIHQGAFLPWIALFMFSTVLLYNSSKIIFWLIFSINSGLFVCIYILDIFVKDVSVGLGYLLAVAVSMLAFASSCIYSARLSKNSG